ncbi:MAG: helix-turn-helix transcriptional regulator [Ruminococcus sp.]|nr:helix-turn-helix transcriptional regulator [Candidatus Apopatosoma intestinale]
MDILKKINKMRLERKWSVYKLSAMSGVAQSTLNNMFNRETLPSIPTLQLLCDAFGITVSEFFKEDTLTTSAEDDEILRCYHRLNGSEKEAFMVLLRSMSKK